MTMMYKDTAWKITCFEKPLFWTCWPNSAISDGRVWPKINPFPRLYDRKLQRYRLEKLMFRKTAVFGYVVLILPFRIWPKLSKGTSTRQYRSYNTMEYVVTHTNGSPTSSMIGHNVWSLMDAPQTSQLWTQESPKEVCWDPSSSLPTSPTFLNT